MAAKLDGTTYTCNGFTFDLSGIKKVRGLMEFQDVAKTGDMATMITFIAESGMVEAAPFDGDFSTVDAYLDLDVQDWTTLQGELLEAVQKFLAVKKPIRQ